MGNVLTSQPGKGLWTLFALALNTARFPLWMLWYLPPFLRQHPTWSYRQAIMVQIVKTFLWNASMVEIKTPLALLPGAEKEKWAVAKVAPPNTYTGPARIDGTLKPEDCGGTWYPTPNPLGGVYRPKLVILHFHGGAYVIGDGRKKDAAFAAKTLRDNTDATYVFCPQYRLSSNPGCRFPAALQDATRHTRISSTSVRLTRARLSSQVTVQEPTSPWLSRATSPSTVRLLVSDPPTPPFSGLHGYPQQAH